MGDHFEVIMRNLADKRVQSELFMTFDFFYFCVHFLSIFDEENNSIMFLKAFKVNLNFQRLMLLKYYLFLGMFVLGSNLESSKYNLH